MAQLRSFSLIGDSNIRRHLSSNNTSGRPLMVEAQFIPCGRLSTLAASLSSVRPESDACVVACITNFITGAVTSSSTSASLCVEHILSGFLGRVFEFATSRNTVQVFICPPMYRTNPLWYRDGLSDIMIKFSSMFAKPDRPANIRMMPGFQTPQLEADGVHLNPYSGSQYILYLFNTPQDIINDSDRTVDVRLTRAIEHSGSVESRLVLLEQDHARLNQKFEHHCAVNAELLDYDENVRNEVFLMVQGLPPIGKVDPKEWQVKARTAVDKVFSDMGFDNSIRSKYVQNSTGKGKDARTLYKVRVSSAEVSRTIRDKFGSYFAGGVDARPPSLAGLSVRNCVTPATLGRIAIMQLLGKRYKESNPGSKFQMVAFESRPLLKLTPPPDVSDRRVQTYNFIEAVTKLPTTFSQAEVDGLVKRISPRLHKDLRSLFIVLSEDMLKTRTSKRSADQSVVSGSESSTPGASAGRRKRPSPGTSSGPASKK